MQNFEAPTRTPSGPGKSSGRAHVLRSRSRIDFAARFPRLLADRPEPDPERQRRQVEEARLDRLGEFLRQRGRRYQNCTFRNFETPVAEQAEARDRVMNYLHRLDDHLDAGTNLILYGPSGTGKDHLLCAAAKVAIMAGHAVQWRAGMDLWDTVYETIRTGGRQRLLAPLETCGILIISDPLPPTGGLAELSAAALSRIVDRRYSLQKPTWLTMNIADRPEADARLGASVMDRLCHNAVAHWCGWESYRKS